jgi:oligopeptide/dipeptide ABC transporter ATP-binding protein
MPCGISWIQGSEGELMDSILQVRDLRTYFYTHAGTVKAVDGATFRIEMGEMLGLIGETGCGKSMTGFSIMRLIPLPGRIVGGEIMFEGDNLLEKSEPEMRRIRGQRISMIFQEPSASLNPTFSIGEQMVDVLRIHKQLGRREATKEVAEMLRLVRLPDAEKKLRQYPHELSGGMQQRVMIAMALLCGPSLLIADEPTTSLDVSLEAQILELMKELRQKYDMSALYITHNAAVAAENCDRIAVMYAGRIVECGSVSDFFRKPLHPYSKGLLNSIPAFYEKGREIPCISGTVPDMLNPPSGCPFHPRCPEAIEICRTIVPQIKSEEDRTVMCHLYV